jgi:phage tail-like protein
VRLVNFRADAHASGGRIDVSWEIHPDVGETLDGTVPEVQVRRKSRDFSYPPPADGDPFLIYDGATFSADRTLAPRFERENGHRVTEILEADEVTVGDDTVLVPRRWIRTCSDEEGGIHHIRVHIADHGMGDAGLAPGTVYYYQISGALVPAVGSRLPYRATAQATAHHGSGDQLYRLLPGIHQRYDERGELRAFLSIFGDQLDLMRSFAEGLPVLHDVDTCDYRALPLLADWIGWDLNYAAQIPIRRHEIKYAAALYRITGTIPGCMIWVKRLTGWEARVKEFYRNVFFSNDLGNPDDPMDHGSRTVDASDPDLLADVGTYGDDLDYTYETGTTDEDWYAYNVVGIFARPSEGETVATVLRKKTNLVNNLSLFMPVNIRGVVILETDTAADTHGEAMDLLGGSSDETP